MCLIVIRLGIIFFALFVFTAIPGFADDGKWNTVGLRAGIGDSRNSESFSQYEAYVTFSLPWKWESDSKWIIGSFIGANAGAVICEDNAFVGSIGPGVYLMTPVERVVLSAGIFPNYFRCGHQFKFSPEHDHWVSLPTHVKRRHFR